MAGQDPVQGFEVPTSFIIALSKTTQKNKKFGGAHKSPQCETVVKVIYVVASLAVSGWLDLNQRSV